MKINKCRYCKSELKQVLSLGNIPIVNHFVKKDDLKKEKKYPLNLVVCRKCGLAQLDFIILPDKLFLHYDYLTSASEPLSTSLNKLALFCIQKFKIGNKSKVLDIGCNDGSLLDAFKNQKSITIGIEPALAVAEIAQKKGINVYPKFLNLSLAKGLKTKYREFDLIYATRVMANILDLSDFMNSVKLLLAPNGVFVGEVSSLKAMIDSGHFDAIYHEHYSYFSEKFLHKLFRANDLTIFKVEKLSSQGGELRIFAKHASSKVKKAISTEKISSRDYERFSTSAIRFKNELNQLIGRKKGKIIIGIGAPAKSVTLLNFCGIGRDQIKYIADSTASKQNKYMPGVGIPIVNEEKLKDTEADYYLLLAWTYKEEILTKMRKILPRGTKIIIPFPKLKIVKI